MSADFTTSLRVEGTKEECLEIMKVLYFYANDRQEQYRKKRDCWYLDETFDSPEEEVEECWKSGEMSLMLSGPYGIMNGPVGDVIDLFERIADVAPSCHFYGSISGWDAGGDQSLDAELKNGLLYLRSSFSEFGEDEFEDEDFEDEEFEEETDEDVNDGDAWDTVYDPKTKSYSQVSSASEGDSVGVTILLYDKSGEVHALSLPSDVIEAPINLNCYPEDFLKDNSVEKLFSIIIDAIDGDGAEIRKADIIAFRDSLEAEVRTNGISKLELVKVHDHKAPFFFGWLRANATYPEMKKLAKKVCTCAEKNKQNNIDEFEKYLEGFEPWFPGCEYTGWPEFCMYHVVDEGNGRLAFQRNPNRKVITKLDWSCVATSVEDFAKVICSKENPREYAVERVLVDYDTGTIEQTAVYMPGGPEPLKALPAVKQENSCDTNSHTKGEGLCSGMTFVITGKVKATPRNSIRTSGDNH